jgi:dynein heavy chain, axonemal
MHAAAQPMRVLWKEVTCNWCTAAEVHTYVQAQLEDQILYMLSNATGSLLDNVALITTLDQSKTTWEEVNAMLATAEETSKKIEAASQAFRPCSVRASILYFVLNDLSHIDGMYQFSLDAYTGLFELSIRSAAKFESLPERIRALNDHHTHAVYKYTARGLFERHKLLLSLQMCNKILSAAKNLAQDEFSFFMRGGTVLDRSPQALNPDPLWISEEAWDNVTEMEAQVAAFGGLEASIRGSLQEWEAWCAFISNAFWRPALQRRGCAPNAALGPASLSAAALHRGTLCTGAANAL